MPFGQPQDEELPNYHPFLMAAAGAAPVVPGAAPAAPGQVAQQTPAAPVAAPVASAVPVQQSQASQTAQAPPAAPAVVLPTAPQAPSSNMEQYHALEAQLQQDSAPQTVKPHWYDRLAGAAVGFGAAYHGDVAGGIRAGGAVTNRGQIDADINQSRKVDADRAAIDTFKQGAKMETDAYENQARQFGMDMQGANAQREQGNADRTFNEGKADRDRNFNRDTANDDFSHKNSDRQYERSVTEFDATNKRESDRDKESSRHNRAEEGISYARESREAKDAKDRKDKEKDTTVSPAQWQTLLQDRDKAYAAAAKEIEDGGGTPAEQQSKKTAVAATLQNEWSGRLATADPNGRYAQRGGQQQAPAAAAPADKPAAVQQPPAGRASLKASDYAPLPPDKVRLVSPDGGKVQIGPKAKLSEAVARGWREVK